MRFEDAEREELAGDLVAERVVRHDHEKLPDRLRDLQRQHRFRLAGAGRHDDGGRAGRAGGVGKRRVHRPYLRPSQSRQACARLFRGAPFLDPEGVLPRGDHVPGALCRLRKSLLPRLHAGWREPPALAAGKSGCDLARLDGARHEKQEIGIDLGRRLLRNDPQERA